MRILLVGPIPSELGSRNFGGIARHVWYLANALREAGHEVSILAVGKYFGSSKTVDQIRIIGPRSLDWVAQIPRARRQLASSNARLPRRAQGYAVYTGARLQSLLRATSYDVIHVHAVNHGAQIWLGAAEHDYNVVTTIHSYSGLVFADESAMAGQRTLYDKAIGASSAVIHVSKADRGKGERLGVRHNTREFVIPNGLPGFDRTPDNEDRSGVCFAGSLTPTKGLPMLLAAWRLRPKTESMLRIAGRGPLLKRIEATARHDSSIRILGYLDEKELASLFASSRCLVVPSVSESFGIVYLEALACGTPVVGYHETLVELTDLLSLDAAEKEFVLPFDARSSTPECLLETIQRAEEVSIKGTPAVSRRVSEKVVSNFSWAEVGRMTQEVYGA